MNIIIFGAAGGIGRHAVDVYKRQVYTNGEKPLQRALKL